MKNLDTREWLLANGLGSFASGTVGDARTRTYHGWLIAAVDPPSQRTLLLSHLEASIEIGGQIWGLGTNFWGSNKIDPLGYELLQSFDIEPVPKWVWGRKNWQLSRQMVMPYGFLGNMVGERDPHAQFFNGISIQYRYTGRKAAILRLRLLIGDRNFHHQQLATPELQFWQLFGQQRLGLQAIRPNWTGTAWQLRWSSGDYQSAGVWYWNYHYPEEHRRGVGDREDLYSPGYLTVTLQPGEAIALEAKVGWDEAEPPKLYPHDFEKAVEAEQQRLSQLLSYLPAARQKIAINSPSLRSQLLRAGDQFIVYRRAIAGPTVIAGYPWFNDWGRDTLIALPGLALSTGRFDLAQGVLETFGRYCRYGLIPNTFPDDGSDALYNSIDAALWWIETLGLYLEATQNWAFLRQQYPVFRQIYKAFSTGTLFKIQVDATDGLLGWNAPDVAITWMDAAIDGEVITPRQGKPIEINALWYSALCWASKWAEQLAIDPTPNSDPQSSIFDPVRLSKQARSYSQQAQQVKDSLQKFWNPARQYFYDVIAPDDQLDPRIRPNAVLALSLHHCGFPEEQGRLVLQIARDRLLTPYGLRSLAPNEPDYIGQYAGDRQHRDRAYHQGTVWSWLIGAFIRAWQRFYPSEPVPFDWQPLIEHFQQQACLGSVSEIFDGDPPHAPQGAFAQAWSVAELIRHLPDDFIAREEGRGARG